MNMLNHIRGGVSNIFDRVWINYYSRKVSNSAKSNEFVSVAEKYPLSKEQKQQVDDLYGKCLGRKVPYLWHQYFAAHSGKFTPEYFPDFLLHGYFEHFMNFNNHYPFVFEDKNVLPYIAQSADVLMPKTILSKTCGVMRKGDNEIVSMQDAVDILRNAGKVFCKPSTGSCGGKGCFIKDFSSITDNGGIVQILNDLGNDFIIQEPIQCHHSIRTLYPSAVNTFRVITYRWKDEFVHMPVFMRIGRGGAVVDNGASGGMFIGVRNDGTLTDYAVTRNEVRIPVHPDTGVEFKGHNVANFDAVLDAAIKMHTMIPQVGLVYWDFTINEAGIPVLIECNILNGTVYAIQMTHGVGPFGDKTAEVLSWIRRMNALQKSKRIRYSFGRM